MVKEYTKEERDAIIQSIPSKCSKCQKEFLEMAYMGKTSDGRAIWLCPECEEKFDNLIQEKFDNLICRETAVSRSKWR